MLALFVLWLGYYVPHHVKHRQQLLDSRADDRFSGSLRVLAVATGATPVQSQKIQGQKNSTELADRQWSNAGPLLQRTPARGVPVGATYMTRSTTQPEQEEGTNAMETTTRVTEPRPPARPGTGSSDGRPAARRAASASRLALLERRAAAARRRLALTVVLLVASAVVWVTAGLGVVPWLVALIPTALLALVLVLGRQAVRAGRRADAAWSAQRKGAARSSQGPTAGRPAASGSSVQRITGHAIRTSQTRTQMIPRVTAADVARAREHVAEVAAVDVAAEAPAEVVTESGEAVVTDAAAEEMTAVARADAWDPVPVPRPTYTMKATAPRREPMPLPSDEPADTNGEAVAPVHATPSGTESGAPTGVKPKTETLGLDLNQILARRRASGQ